MLVNPGNQANQAVAKRVEATAPQFGVTTAVVSADTPANLAEAFGAMARAGEGAVIIAADAFFSGQGRVIADAALRNRVAAIGLYVDHVVAGTLMSYGPDVADYHRQSAVYVDKILKGAKPGDLPVEEPTKIALAINTGTAAALGLTVPPTLLARADRVIE